MNAHTIGRPSVLAQRTSVEWWNRGVLGHGTQVRPKNPAPGTWEAETKRAPGSPGGEADHWGPQGFFSELWLGWPGVSPAPALSRRLPPGAPRGWGGGSLASAPSRRLLPGVPGEGVAALSRKVRPGGANSELPSCVSKPSRKHARIKPKK